jgi:hypothetical protein
MTTTKNTDAEAFERMIDELIGVTEAYDTATAEYRESFETEMRRISDSGVRGEEMYEAQRLANTAYDTATEAAHAEYAAARDAILAKFRAGTAD